MRCKSLAGRDAREAPEEAAVQTAVTFELGRRIGGSVRHTAVQVELSSEPAGAHALKINRPVTSWSCQGFAHVSSVLPPAEMNLCQRPATPVLEHLRGKEPWLFSENGFF